MDETERFIFGQIEGSLQPVRLCCTLIRNLEDEIQRTWTPPQESIAESPLPDGWENAEIHRKRLLKTLLLYYLCTVKKTSRRIVLADFREPLLLSVTDEEGERWEIEVEEECRKFIGMVHFSAL